MVFWYRTSPRGLEPDSPSPSVTPADPALTITGQSLVTVDTRGRLVEFRRVPPQRDPTGTTPAAQPNWDVLFRAAGLAQASFSAVPPDWTPKDFADVRAAWEGPSPDAPDLRLRVEAAAYRGRIASFYLVGPWTRPRAQEAVPQPRAATALRLFGLALWLSVLAAAILIARHHIVAHRADQRGAARLAIIGLLVQIAAWAIGGHHLSSPAEEVNSFFRVFGNLLFQAAELWVLYLALEPYGRRFWPDGLLGWTRLFTGHVRDPRIGREILIGAALGGTLILADVFRALAPYLIGRPPGPPALDGDVTALGGLGSMALVWSGQFYGSIQTALIITMTFVALRLVVRRTWLAVLIGMLVISAAVAGNVQFGHELWLYAISQVLTIGLITFAIFRFGLLVTTVMLIVDNIPTAVPILPHAAAWAALPGNLSIALVVAAACFGFYAARAGQPLFGKID